ncbi:MAG: response regulator transcription factor [Cyanobacteria bacterium]|nr:response regulator transcription factor [Cyanobacteriota bacterium]
MAKVLIIEDDLTLATSLTEWFNSEGYRAETIPNGADGLQLLICSGYDLAVIDWQLPEISGPEICRRYRQQGGKIPILMMTRKAQTMDKAQGLDAGADDYLAKPFEIMELAARVRALLRRSTGLFDASSITGPISLDFNKCQVTIRGKKIQLVPREFDVLEFLVRHADSYISSEKLFAHVWESSAEVTNEAMRMCIVRLRKKIEDPELSPVIESVKGLGYKFCLSRLMEEQSG